MAWIQWFWQNRLIKVFGNCWNLTIHSVALQFIFKCLIYFDHKGIKRNSLDWKVSPAKKLKFFFYWTMINLWFLKKSLSKIFDLTIVFFQIILINYTLNSFLIRMRQKEVKWSHNNLILCDRWTLKNPDERSIICDLNITSVE